MMAAANIPTLAPVDMCMFEFPSGEGEGEVVLIELVVGGVVVVWVASVDAGVVCGFCCRSDVVAVLEPDATAPWITNGLRDDAILPSASMPSSVHLLPGASECGIHV